MVRYILIFIFFLIANKNYAQDEYKMAEGFYNLSGFEIASGIYLLENKTFFYYATFGNVDLRIFGDYEIQDQGTLIFKPDDDLTNEFYVYGTTNDIKSDSITLIYKQPFREEFERVLINNEVEFPKFTSEENTVSITIKNTNSKILNLKSVNHHSYKTQKGFSVQLTDNIAELRIIHNYYADMVSEFSNVPLKINKDFLIDDNQKIHKKKDIDEQTINEILDFIENNRLNNTFDIDGRVYIKLNSHKN